MLLPIPLRAIITVTAALIVTASLIATFVRRGGPYFATPATVYDHVARDRHPTIDDVNLCRAAAPFIPRGATVTILKPSETPNYDTTHTNTAAGLLPHQRLVAAGPRLQSEYALTIQEPLDDARYRLLRTFAEGNLYERVR